MGKRAWIISDEMSMNMETKPSAQIPAGTARQPAALSAMWTGWAPGPESLSTIPVMGVKDLTRVGIWHGAAFRCRQAGEPRAARSPWPSWCIAGPASSRLVAGNALSEVSLHGKANAPLWCEMRCRQGQGPPLTARSGIDPETLGRSIIQNYALKIGR